MAPKAKRLAGGGANSLKRRLRRVAKPNEKVFIRMRRKMSPYEAFDLAMDRLHRRSKENELEALEPVKHVAAMIKEAGVPMTKPEGETREDKIRWAKKLKRELFVPNSKLKHAKAFAAGELPMCVRNEYDLDSGRSTATDLSLPPKPGQFRLPPTPGYGEENTPAGGSNHRSAAAPSLRGGPPPRTPLPMPVSVPLSRTPEPRSIASAGSRMATTISAGARSAESRVAMSATSRGAGEGRRRVRAAAGTRALESAEPLDMDSYPI